MNTIVKCYITRLVRSFINYKISKEEKRPRVNTIVNADNKIRRSYIK